VQKSYLLTPSYIRLRKVLVDTLRPHPEIAAKVAAAIAEIEDDEVAIITAKANKPPLLEHQPTA